MEQGIGHTCTAPSAVRHSPQWAGRQCFQQRMSPGIIPRQLW
jgi:hypothetical protein